MINPFPESALNEEAGKLFMEDYDEYAKKAKLFTEIHALKLRKGDSSADENGEHVEKRQKPVDSTLRPFRLDQRRRTTQAAQPMSDCANIAMRAGGAARTR